MMSAGRRASSSTPRFGAHGGRLLAGGTPPRLVRLSGAGAAALDRLIAERPRPTRQPRPWLRGWSRGGLLHPLPDDGEDESPVTAVVPVLDGGEPLSGLIRVLAAEGPVIVVDDGSHDGSAERAAAAGARVIPNEGRSGPAGARNTGLRAAATELVAFVDADCVVAFGLATRVGGPPRRRSDAGRGGTKGPQRAGRFGPRPL